MAESALPEPVIRFLKDHITSVEQLEVLILLRSAEAREWSAVAVSDELRSSVMSIRDRLASLAAHRLLIAEEVHGEEVYRYAPATDEARRLVDGVVKAYKERRLTVISLIYERRESDVVTFAEAFKIMKKKGDG